MSFIEKILKKSGWMSILESVVFILLGIILVANPEGAVKLISYVLGAIFIIVGICKIFQYVAEKGKNDFFNYDLVYGILAIIIGIITIACIGTIASILRIIVGVWIIYTALVRLSSALKLRKLSGNIWIYSAVLAVIMLICGLVTLLYSDAIVVTIGAMMIIYSVIDIVEAAILIKNADKLE